jgi:hypothetical protein
MTYCCYRPYADRAVCRLRIAAVAPVGSGAPSLCCAAASLASPIATLAIDAPWDMALCAISEWLVSPARHLQVVHAAPSCSAVMHSVAP